MSNQYSKTKGKKLRRRTSSAPDTRTKSEIAIEKLASQHNITVHEKMKDDKYFRLLRRLLNGRVDQGIFSLLESLTDEQLTYGTIDSVFKASSPIKSLIKLGCASLPDMSINGGEFIAQRVGSLVYLCDKRGKVLKYNPKKMVYTRLLSSIELPVDLRKWDADWAKFFIRAGLVDNISNDRCNVGSSKFLLAGGTSKLHSIRKINPNPGKRQRAVVQKTKAVYDMDQVVMPAAGQTMLFSY